MEPPHINIIVVYPVEFIGDPVLEENIPKMLSVVREYIKEYESYLTFKTKIGNTVWDSEKLKYGNIAYEHQERADKLAEKMHIEYPILATNYKKIIESKNTFNELGLKDKKDTINGIINLLSGKEGNLKKIGLGDREGRIKDRKFEYNKLKNMIFVEKSVTGMYERRYKIDGLENSCSN